MKGENGAKFSHFILYSPNYNGDDSSEILTDGNHRSNRLELLNDLALSPAIYCIL
jgi:hypothetical protein